MLTLAVDDGLVQGNLDIADLCFLVAVVIFLFLAIYAWVKSKDFVSGLSPLGLCLVALGLLVL